MNEQASESGQRRRHPVADAIGAVYRSAREGDEKVRRRVLRTGKAGLAAASLWVASDVIGLARDALRARPELGTPSTIAASFAHPELVLGIAVLAVLAVAQIAYMVWHERRELERQDRAQERAAREQRDRDREAAERHETLMTLTQATHRVAIAAISQPELTRRVQVLEAANTDHGKRIKALEERAAIEGVHA